MNIYKKLFGLKSIIPATWPYSTHLGGSIMPQEVIEAMIEASRCWVDIDELLKKASKRIAEICASEAALITSGATAGLTLAAAACMTGNDPKKMEQLPHTESLRNEIIVQRGRTTEYFDCGFRAAGSLIVEVGCNYPYIPENRSGANLWTFGTRSEDIERAISHKTAAIADTQSFLCIRKGVIPLEELVQIAKKHNLPMIVDAASELPPVSNLRKFTSMGCDLVVFSGGKAICGPNNTGFILGGRDLIESCAAQTYPHHSRRIVGRGFKLKKEDIVGLVVALERFVNLDFDKTVELERSRARYIYDQFRGHEKIEADLIYPDETGRPIHIVQLTLDEEALGITAKEVAQQLLSGDPSIHVYHVEPINILRIYVHSLKKDEEKLVAQRIKSALAGRPKD